MVLVHGITDDGLFCSPLAEVMAVNMDVIMVHVRGHGKSDVPADGYTLQTMAFDLAVLIPVLGLEKPVLLGHSMGAMTALMLAGLFPDLLDRLV